MTAARFGILETPTLTSTCPGGCERLGPGSCPATSTQRGDLGPAGGPGAELRGLALTNAGFGFRLLSPLPALRCCPSAASSGHRTLQAAPYFPLFLPISPSFSLFLLISPYFLFLQLSSSSSMQALSLRLRGCLVPALSQGHWGGSWVAPDPPGHLQRGGRARAARGQAPPGPAAAASRRPGGGSKGPGKRRCPRPPRD